MGKHPISVESGQGGMVEIRVFDAETPQTICYFCPLEQRGQGSVGCSGFSGNGMALIDPERRNIKMLIDGEGDDPTKCGVIGEIRKRRNSNR